MDMGYTRWQEICGNGVGILMAVIQVLRKLILEVQMPGFVPVAYSEAGAGLTMLTVAGQRPVLLAPRISTDTTIPDSVASCRQGSEQN